MQKYKQIVVSHFMSNDNLIRETKNYNIMSVVNTTEGIVYIMKRKNIFVRIINKLFNI